MRVLSGIQPSGALHIGNYLGAIRQYIDLQRGNDAFYFVADYHALTSVRDAEKLRGYVFDVIVDLLALGLDPEVATLFVQSDVPETTELAWLLTSVTPMGWLEKAVSYKDKVQQGLPAEHGLFAYPVLQAADILLYDADVVPVGQDQKQHLEITRDIADRFNHVYGETFKLPKPHILDGVAVVPGLDGRKMSKSYDNAIEIFDDPRTILKKCKKIVTDSTPVEAPKDPEKDTLFQLFRLFAPLEDVAEVEGRYRAGGIGYGEVKTRLAEHITRRFAEASRAEARTGRESRPGPGGPPGRRRSCQDGGAGGPGPGAVGLRARLSRSGLTGSGLGLILRGPGPVGAIGLNLPSRSCRRSGLFEGEVPPREGAACGGGPSSPGVASPSGWAPAARGSGSAARRRPRPRPWPAVARS